MGSVSFIAILACKLGMREWARSDVTVDTGSFTFFPVPSCGSNEKPLSLLKMADAGDEGGAPRRR